MLKRWLRALLVAIVGLLMTAAPVLAVTSVDVTITATPLVSTGIVGFTITYVNDQQLDLSWGFSGDAVKIMVRAKYGDYPADIPNEDTTPTDGYLVYYGDGVTASDTTMDFEQNAGVIYYKAWAQKADGKWYMFPSSGEEESRVMYLLGFIFLALGLTICTFALKSGRRILAFAAAGAWLLLGIYSYTQSTAVWDIFYALFMLSCIMVFACVLVPAVLREKKEGDSYPTELTEEDHEYYDQMQDEKKERARFDTLYGKKKAHKAKPSVFARTGIEKR